MFDLQTDPRILYQAWESKARVMVLAGWERRDYPNPLVPTTFHKDGQTAILICMTGGTDWRAKLIS